MTVIKLRGYVTEAGELRVQLPKGFPAGEVNLVIHTTENSVDGVEFAPTLEFHSSTLGEILDSGLIGAWADEEITDSQTWVDEVRRQEQEQRKWPKDEQE